MVYDLRDLLFDYVKEYRKQRLRGDIHRRCENMRIKAQMLPQSRRRAALAHIDGLEQQRLQGVDQDMLKTGAIKELFKAIGVIN